MVRSLAKIVLVVLILLVAVPSIQAAPRVEERSGWSVSRALLSLSFLSDLWEAFSSAFGDNGCILDPSGTCRRD